MKISKQRLKQIIKEEIELETVATKYKQLKAKCEDDGWKARQAHNLADESANSGARPDLIRRIRSNAYALDKEAQKTCADRDEAEKLLKAAEKAAAAKQQAAYNAERTAFEPDAMSDYYQSLYPY